MKIFALILAFMLELIAFIFFALVAFTLPIDRYLQFIIAGFMFVGVITFWGLYMSPRATRKLHIFPPIFFKLCIYAVSAYGLLALTNIYFFAIFITLEFLDEVLLTTNPGSI